MTGTISISRGVSPYSFPGLPVSEKTPDIVINMVCAEYGITRDELMLKSRYRNRVLARQVIGLLLRKRFKMGLKEIARMFNQNHTTVLHGLRTIADLIETDEAIKVTVIKLQSQLFH